MVIVGGADGFRDEDIDYALRLNQAGVPTELHVYRGAARRAVVRRFGRREALARSSQGWVTTKLRGS